MANGGKKRTQADEAYDWIVRAFKARRPPFRNPDATVPSHRVATLTQIGENNVRLAFKRLVEESNAVAFPGGGFLVTLNVKPPPRLESILSLSDCIRRSDLVPVSAIDRENSRVCTLQDLNRCDEVAQALDLWPLTPARAAMPIIVFRRVRGAIHPQSASSEFFWLGWEVAYILRDRVGVELDDLMNLPVPSHTHPGPWTSRDNVSLYDSVLRNHVELKRTVYKVAQTRLPIRDREAEIWHALHPAPRHQGPFMRLAATTYSSQCAILYSVSKLIPGTVSFQAVQMDIHFSTPALDGHSRSRPE